MKRNRIYILASRSPRRQLLLRQVGFRFTVCPTAVDETLVPGTSPAANALRIAAKKARAAAGRFRRRVIIGADTVVVIGRRILGKPRTRREAVDMLRLLSGREHSVFTAFVILDGATGRMVSDVVKTKVRFRRLSAREIETYVRSGSPMDKAGSYGIQDDYGAVFVESINGCFYNVVGFPLTRFYQRLEEFHRAGKTVKRNAR